MSKHDMRHQQQSLRAPQNALLQKPAPVNDGLGEIAHAYALVPTKDGRFVTVHLEGVTARVVERLEPNGRAEIGPFSVQRCATAIERRLRDRKWGA